MGGGNSFHSLFYLQPSTFLLHRFFFFFFLEAWRGPSWPLLSGHEWKGDVVSCELRLPGIKTSRVHRVHFMIAAHIRLPRLWWSMDKLTPTKSALNVATCLCTQRCRHLLWEWTSRFVGGGNCSTCLLDVHSEIRRACEKAWASIVCGWCITAIYPTPGLFFTPHEKPLLFYLVVIEILYLWEPVRSSPSCYLTQVWAACTSTCCGSSHIRSKQTLRLPVPSFVILRPRLAGLVRSC